MKKKNDFYSWMDKLADKKAQDWTKAPMKPLDPALVEMQMLNDPTYNYETFYNLQPFMAERMLQADPDAHFTDIGKTMYHPTFSDESAFSGWISDYNPLGIKGGHWNKESTTYTPSKDQLEKYFNYNKTRSYLDQAEDHPVQIIMPKYKGGKDQPSQYLRQIIAKYEGSDFANQNKRFGGDAVGTYYNKTRAAIGDEIWNKLNQNQREALTSYYYNIKPSSFTPTIKALQNWNKTGSTNDLGLVRDSINVGMNNAKLKGLAKRRKFEQDLFMKTPNIQQGIYNGEMTYTVPSSTIVTPLSEMDNNTLISTPLIQQMPINPNLMLQQRPQPEQYIYDYDSGKDIHINPANRGKFNATKKRTGKTTEQLTHSKNPLTRKRAIFALNASKWHH